MDDYPKHLAPEFELSGAVATPFEKWWARVKGSFPNVPENVAREWLHRHWSHSPFSYLISKNYEFELVPAWPKLVEILTSWNDFKPGSQGAIDKGKELVSQRPGFMAYVARYMLEHHKFPTPIIVLDNRDGQHDVDYPEEHGLPPGYCLVEGHTRLNVGDYLESIGQLGPQEVWLMKRNDPIFIGVPLAHRESTD